MKFTHTFLEWLDAPELGFYVSDAWDFEKEDFVGTGRLKLFPHWRRILEFTLKQDEKGRFPYETIILSDIKKSAKTVSVAAITAWYAECSPENTEIVLCANSADQSARLIFKDLSFHYKHTDRATVRKDKIEFENGTIITVLTKNYTSNAGSRHGLVVFDEIWGITSPDDERRFAELTPIPTITHSLRLIASYAGFLGESNLLHDIYLSSVAPVDGEDSECKGEIVPELADLPCYHNKDVYFAYWGHTPRMPWATPEYYAKQITTLRPSEYLRLHENRWVSSNEEFIPIEKWDEAAKHFPQSADLWKDHPYRTYPVYIGVDMGWKHDHTAVIGVTIDSKKGKIVLLFHKTWQPVEGEVLSPEEVEKYIVDQSHHYRIRMITYDPTQLVQTMAKLQKMGFNTNEFHQQGSDMIAATQTLYSALRLNQLWAYPAPDIREHLQNAVAVHTSAGMKIVKDKTNSRLASKKIDSAVALAMAVYRASENVEAIGEAIVIESPFADISAWGTVNMNDQSMLPIELRTDVY